jgi:biopolymer transport protein ExbB/TolQ
MIHQGWYATYLLIVMSVATISIVCERMWFLRGILGKTARLAAKVCPLLQRGQFQNALATAREERTPAGRVFRDVIAQQDGESLEYLAALAEDRRYEEVEALKGPTWILGTVAVSAPFIGLFGTVIGILKAFHSMAIEGSGGFTVVAGGISEALIATALGLGVAIIAVIFYNYLNTKLERIEATLTIGSDRLLDAIRLGRKANGNE